ncbi:hypothetical protein Lal_00022778 [Lupinus albus]|nr:hypothetical protein Lal_00022778 [Lupinus albus]
MNIPILDGKNFDHWSIQMKAIFRFQDCLDVVQQGFHQVDENSTDVKGLQRNLLDSSMCESRLAWARDGSLGERKTGRCEGFSPEQDFARLGEGEGC